MFEIEIQTNFDKLKTASISQVEEDFIKEITEYVVEELKSESPVRTGRLRDGHYSEINGLVGNIYNEVEDAKYVIYGTSKQSANNYPQRVLNNMVGVYESIFLECLQKYMEGYG